MNPTPPTQTPRTDDIERLLDNQVWNKTIEADEAARQLCKHSRTLELELLQAQRERDEAGGSLKLHEELLAEIKDSNLEIANRKIKAFESALKLSEHHVEIYKTELTQLRNAVDNDVKVIEGLLDIHEGHSSKECDDTNCTVCAGNNALTKAKNLPHRKERGV